VIGPALRRDAKTFMDAVRALPHERLIAPPVAINAGGKEIAIPEGAFTLTYNYLIGGEEVDIITVDDVIVTIRKNP